MSGDPALPLGAHGPRGAGSPAERVGRGCERLPGGLTGSWRVLAASGPAGLTGVSPAESRPPGRPDPSRGGVSTTTGPHPGPGRAEVSGPYPDGVPCPPTLLTGPRGPQGRGQEARSQGTRHTGAVQLAALPKALGRDWTGRPGSPYRGPASVAPQRQGTPTWARAHPPGRARAPRQAPRAPRSSRASWRPEAASAGGVRQPERGAQRPRVDACCHRPP